MVITNPKRVVVLGTGSAAHYVIDICHDLGIELVGFVDQNRTSGEMLHGIPVLGGLDVLDDGQLRETAWFAIAVGDNAARRRLISQIRAKGCRPGTLIHPSCVISPHASIGVGVILNPFTSVRIGAKIGDFVLCEGHTRIGYRNRVGDNTVIAAGVVLSADSDIGADCFIGAGVNILPRTSVGDRCLVGAGALVNKNIPDDTLAYGTPAKPRGQSGILEVVP